MFADEQGTCNATVLTLHLHRIGVRPAAIAMRRTVTLTEAPTPAHAYNQALDAARAMISAREASLYSADGRPLLMSDALWLPTQRGTRPIDVYVLRQGQLWVWPPRNLSVTIRDGTEGMDDGVVALRRRIEVLSRWPRVLRIRGLFSANECAILRKAGKGRWQSSGSFDTATGAHYSLTDGRRVSDTAWAGLHWGYVRDGVLTTPAIERLQRRAADAARAHVGHAEPWQVVRYRAGGFQRHHLDGFRDDTLGGTARHVTVLAYLNDVDAEASGGLTQFPYAHDDDPKFAFDPEGCTQGLSVAPRRGDALIFYNAVEEESDGDGAENKPAEDVTFGLDERARHAACPLHSGEKYIANVWLHPTPVNEAIRRCAPVEADAKRHHHCMRKEARAR